MKSCNVINFGNYYVLCISLDYVLVTTVEIVRTYRTNTLFIKISIIWDKELGCIEFEFQINNVFIYILIRLKFYDV